MIFGSKICTINRSILITRPKQPYIDWANSMDDGRPLEHLTVKYGVPAAFEVGPAFIGVDGS